ncbi:hypothetical protein D082_18970 [Synechocystis sp. PCC 6714]|nr:hypothetical protein D082_18970 [Synechocystis sp. PCC 6714]
MALLSLILAVPQENFTKNPHYSLLCFCRLPTVGHGPGELG